MINFLTHTSFRLSRKFFTILARIRFKKFGKGSSMLFGCTVVNPKRILVGENVCIGEFVWLNADTVVGHEKDKVSLTIGSGSHISRFVHINAFKNVVIEENVLIGANVYLGDTDHITKRKDIPIIKQGLQVKGKVLIKSGSYICKNSIIAAGITIGKNSIVAPGAYVLTDVPDHAMALGNPATIIENYNK